VTGDFVVSIGAGMTVNVAAGYGLVRGVGVDNPSSRALNIAAAHATLPRIDTVVLELVRTVGTSEGKVTLKVVTGTANASPVAPTLTQDANTWQAPLYDVRVNALAVTPTSVTDRRGVPATTVSRNPTLLPVLRTSPGATSLTTTPTTVAALQHSVTLVSGVWYEVFCEATMQVASPGGFSAVMACFIEGTANAGASQSLASLTPEALENAHSRSVLGSGAAITCGVLLSELGGDAPLLLRRLFGDRGASHMNIPSPAAANPLVAQGDGVWRMPDNHGLGPGFVTNLPTANKFWHGQFLRKAAGMYVCKAVGAGFAWQAVGFPGHHQG
jgi:hypothetical protein